MSRIVAENGPDSDLATTSPGSGIFLGAGGQDTSVTSSSAEVPSLSDDPAGKGSNAADGGSGSSGGGGREDDSIVKDNISDSFEKSRDRRKAAQLKARFASERDAILRRVGVRKQDGRNGNISSSSSSSKGNNRAPTENGTTADADAHGKAAAAGDGRATVGGRKRRWRPDRPRRKAEPMASSPAYDDEPLPPSPRPRGLMEEFPRIRKNGRSNNRSASSPDKSSGGGGSGDLDLGSRRQLGNRDIHAARSEAKLSEGDGEPGRSSSITEIIPDSGDGGDIRYDGAEVREGIGGRRGGRDEGEGGGGGEGDGRRGVSGRYSRGRVSARVGARFSGERLLVTGDR